MVRVRVILRVGFVARAPPLSQEKKKKQMAQMRKSKREQTDSKPIPGDISGADCSSGAESAPDLKSHALGDARKSREPKSRTAQESLSEIASDSISDVESDLSAVQSDLSVDQQELGPASIPLTNPLTTQSTNQPNKSSNMINLLGSEQLTAKLQGAPAPPPPPQGAGMAYRPRRQSLRH